MLPDEVEQEPVHGKVALLSYPVKDGPVGEIIIVMGVLADIEESVQPQPRRLMDLEI